MTPDTAASHEEIRAAIAAADLRVLVVCLYHLTGDEGWLAPQYQPARDVRLIGDPMAGFAPEVAEQLREALFNKLTSNDPQPAVLDPGEEKFGRMLSFFLGEAVPSEYLPMLREDFGFAPRLPDPEPLPDNGKRPTVLIIGAGASGLCLARSLEHAGYRWRIVEKNSAAGGTWAENHYPGCGVDTPSHFYSYSFTANPNWSRYFCGSDELRAYLQTFANAATLRERIEFDAKVTGAQWQTEDSQWLVDIESSIGSRREAWDIVVAATGHFNEPRGPMFAGEVEFTGRLVHTARWPEDLDLKGKRVAVVGTGASSMQLVPTIADEVASLTIFQRTAQWARPVPEYKQAVDARSAWLFRHVPMYDRWYRFAQMWRYGDGLLRFLRRDPDWEQPDRSMNRVNERHRVEIEDYIRTELAGDEALIEKCMPDYPPFAKRILIDNGWYSTLRKSHVTLITEAITNLQTAGIQTSDGGDHEFDVIIYATGFDVTNLAARIDFRGIDNFSLAQDWADDNPRALLGMTVPQFPNLFILYGPNTNMGHGGSGLWLAETQGRYVLDRLEDMVRLNLAAFNCKAEQRDTYTQRIDDLHSELIWTHPGTRTYYRTKNGHVRSPMPFRLVDYWQMTRSRGIEDFDTTSRAN